MRPLPCEGSAHSPLINKCPLLAISGPSPLPSHSLYPLGSINAGQVTASSSVPSRQGRTLTPCGGKAQWQVSSGHYLYRVLFDIPPPFVVRVELFPFEVFVLVNFQPFPPDEVDVDEPLFPPALIFIFPILIFCIQPPILRHLIELG